MFSNSFSRRKLLHGSVLFTAGAFLSVRRIPAGGLPPTNATAPLTIDVHCHFFNGTDLQMEKFIEHIQNATGEHPGDAALAVPTENSVRIKPHPCGTLIAGLVDALSLLASTAESKDWECLPHPVVECIQLQGVRVVKESGFDQQRFGRVDQGEAAFPLRKANVEATGLLRLSGASLVSVV